MTNLIRHWVLPLAATVSMVSPAPNALGAAPGAATAPDFLRDVRPILSSHCFKCHGPDDATRKGGLRLDSRDAPLIAGKYGELAIVPKQPHKSAVIKRFFDG